MTAPAAPAVVTDSTRQRAAVPGPDQLGFLTETHPEYRARIHAWRRDERRLAGGDAVLPELARWRGETPHSYRQRWSEAKYLNFANLHASVLAGHIERVRPMPGRGFSLGPMGAIRTGDDLTGARTEAELFWYGADGIGHAANQFPKVAADIQKRACATGHRWTMVEMPSLAAVRRRAGIPDRGQPSTREDTAAGHRPYLVEYSPARVPYWETMYGELQWCVIRTPVPRQPRRPGEPWQRPPREAGYYLLVRQGYRDLGDAFTRGGWWLFNPDRTPALDEAGQVLTGRWDDTGGAIPMFPLVAAGAEAEHDVPEGMDAPWLLGYGADLLDDVGANAAGELVQVEALAPLAMQAGGPTVLPMSRSLTMELGQIGVALMNRLSERDYNFAHACRSITYVVGVDPKSSKGFNLMVGKVEAGSIIVPVPAWVTDQGDVQVPTLQNSSAHMADAEAGDTIVRSTMEEAREMMVRQLRPPSEESGEARRVEFASGTSPLLTSMLRSRETWEGNVVYWTCRRAGYTHEQAWRAISVWPAEVELQPILDDIDATFDTLTRSGLRSTTLAAHLVEKAARERNVWPEDQTDTIRDELGATENDVPPGEPGGDGDRETEGADDQDDQGDQGDRPAPRRFGGLAGQVQPPAEL